MHYYQFNIGDYVKSTRHLSPIEDIAYRRLLDLYYDTEKPLDLDIEKLTRLIGLKDFKKETHQILSEYFDETKKGFIQKRVQRELSKYSAKATAARENGKLGGRPKITQSVNSANPELTQSKAKQETLTNNHKPILKHTMLSPAGDNVPFQKIIDLYHSLLPELPKCEILNTTRKGYIRQRWQDKEHGLFTIEHWENFFNHVKKSDFLMGKTQSTNGRPPFRANLEWITKLNNYTKIYEDKYHGK